MPSDPASAPRALLFEGDASRREIPFGPGLPAPEALRDDQLLWIDLPGAPDPALLARLGLDPARVAFDQDAGVSACAQWRYFGARALNWRDGTSHQEVPVVIAVGRNQVVTLHPTPVEFIEMAWAGEGDYLRIGRLEAMSFATSLLDRMLTDVMDARDEFETALDKVELDILRRSRPQHLRKLQALRHLAFELRQSLADQRDLFDALARADFDPAQDETVAAHCRALSSRYSKVTQSVEGMRDLVAGSFALYTSRSAESTNKAMHTLTVVTVVMGLAATVAGILGMNFEASLFSAGERGFWIVAGLVSAMVLGVIAWAIYQHLRREP